MSAALRVTKFFSSAFMNAFSNMSPWKSKKNAHEKIKGKSSPFKKNKTK
jgi:hypothetical protein